MDEQVVENELFFFFSFKCNRVINWTFCAKNVAQGIPEHFQCVSFQRYILDFLPLTSAQSPHYTLMRCCAKPRTFAGRQTFQYSFAHFEPLSKNKCFLIIRPHSASVILWERWLNMAATGRELCNSNTRSFTVSPLFLLQAVRTAHHGVYRTAVLCIPPRVAGLML